MIKEKIKSWFEKKYFVYGNVQLEIKKHIADEMQSTFDEIICIAKLKGYEIEEEHYFGYLIVTIYYGKYSMLCALYMNKSDKQMSGIGISLYNQRIQHYTDKEMIEVLKKLKKFILIFEV